MRDLLDYFRDNPNTELDFDSVSDIGLDGTGRDGDERFPYTWAKLTDAERGKLTAWLQLSDAERDRIREERHQQSMAAAGVTRAAV